MTNRKNASNGKPTGERNYPVGKGKPPIEHQFKPGQSGNPSGRPKKMKSEREVIEALLAKDYEIKTADGVEKVQGIELVHRRTFKASVDGCTKQTKILFQRMDVTGAGREEVEPVDLTAADEAMLEEFVEHARRKPKDEPDAA